MTTERGPRPIATRHGLPPLSAKHLQEAIVSSTLVYGAEVVQEGRGGVAGSFQESINRIGRTTLRVLPSTPVAFLQAEGDSMPAEARG